jgi:hypothetical protein
LSTYSIGVYLKSLEKERGSDEKLIDCQFFLERGLKEANGGQTAYRYIKVFFNYIARSNLKVTSRFILLESERDLPRNMILDA